jgi:hypothetical protein
VNSFDANNASESNTDTDESDGTDVTTSGEIGEDDRSHGTGDNNGSHGNDDNSRSDRQLDHRNRRIQSGGNNIGEVKGSSVANAAGGKRSGGSKGRGEGNDDRNDANNNNSINVDKMLFYFPLAPPLPRTAARFIPLSNSMSRS